MRWYHHVSYFVGGAFIANFVPHFEARRTLHIARFGLGFALMAIMISRHFGRLHGGLL